MPERVLYDIRPETVTGLVEAALANRGNFDLASFTGLHEFSVHVGKPMVPRLGLSEQTEAASAMYDAVAQCMKAPVPHALDGSHLVSGFNKINGVYAPQRFISDIHRYAMADSPAFEDNRFVELLGRELSISLIEALKSGCYIPKAGRNRELRIASSAEPPYMITLSYQERERFEVMVEAQKTHDIELIIRFAFWRLIELLQNKDKEFCLPGTKSRAVYQRHYVV